MAPDLEALRKLPLSHKLEIIDALWQDVEAETNACPLSAEQMAEIRRRAAIMEADPHEGLSLEEMWKEVDRLNG